MADSHRGIRGYACVPCSKRKVRCDRLEPCTNCKKRPGEQCVYLAPLPRRRGPRSSPDAATLDRLSKLEAMVRHMGGDPNQHIPAEPSRQSTTSAPPSSSASAGYMPATPQSEHDVARDNFFVPVTRQSVAMLPQTTNTGRLLADSQARTRYIDDALWNSIDDETRDDTLLLSDSEALDGYPDPMPCSQNPQNDGPGSLLLGSPRTRAHLACHHPGPSQIHGLWCAFRSNVHPLLHIFTTWQKDKIIGHAMEDRRELSNRTELFLFAMYLFAVLSMTTEECKNLMGESRLILLDRYQGATEQALLNAGFLRTTDITVLQSFIMYMLCIRQRSDSSTLWMLSGVALRLAQRIGLHKDGTMLGLSAYQTELRRRLWWQVVFLDGRAAELAGTRSFAMLEHDVKLPSNLSDEELQPDLQEIPEVRLGPANNMHCLVRFEIFNFFTGLKRNDGSNAGFSYFGDRDIPLATKNAAIDDLEKLLQHKYVQFCDLLDPVHFITNIVVRAATNGIRLMAHHPQNRGESLTDLPPLEREYLVTLATRSMELDVLCYTTKMLRPLLWHVDNYFHWNGLILILVELRRDPGRVDAKKLWELLQEVYTAHPHFATDRRKTLHVAVGRLAVKAWQARSPSICPQHLATPPAPAFVRTLQEHQTAEDQARRNRPDPTPRVTAIQRRERALIRSKLLSSTGGIAMAEDGLSAADDDPIDVTGDGGDGSGGAGDDNSHISLSALDGFGSEGQSSAGPSPGVSMGTLDFSPMDWSQWDALIFEQLQMDDYAAFMVQPGQGGASAPFIGGEYQNDTTMGGTF